jgi:hypothetical protein
MKLRDVFIEYIPDGDEIEQFAAWAFGTGYGEIDYSLDFMKAWNDLHGDKLNLEPTGQVSTDVPKMVQLWKDNK